MNATSPPTTEEPSPKPHRLPPAWLSLLIPIVVVAAVFVVQDHISDQSLLLYCVIGCGAGCVAFIAGIVGTKARRRWLSVVIGILALLLNIAVGLTALFAYGMANAWRDVKG